MEERSTSIINFSDPELPWLATMAALDLELMRTNNDFKQSEEDSSIEQFKNLYLNSFNSSKIDNKEFHSSVDRLTANMVGKALVNIESNNAKSECKKYYEYPSHIIEKFKKYHLHTQELRDFLLNLADLANEYNHSSLGQEIE